MSIVFNINNLWSKSFSALFISVFAIIVLYNNTFLQMVNMWTISDTYAHGFIVPFISIWLIWRIRHNWIDITPKPSITALLIILIFSGLWFAGNLVNVNSITQLSVVIIIALCIPAILGWEITSKITFPIVFLLFAVPIGDFMLPIMMDWTADFTVIALRWTGIPVYREGLQFVIPSGKWSVVEACSGIRYLLASLTVGSLFAYLNYQSFSKRIIFILFSIVVPLIANWLRAYMIVLIGHYSGNELATGVDHLIYGWVFFGIIILLMLFIGMKWADLENDIVDINKNLHIKNIDINCKNNNFYQICGLIIIIAISPHVADKFIKSRVRDLPVNISRVPSVDPWILKNDSLEKWKPNFSNSADVKDDFYVNNIGQEVGLHISYYRKQNYNSKMITSTNDILNGFSKNLLKIYREKINFDSIDNFPSVESTTLRYEKEYENPKNIQAWKFYWINEEFSSSDIRAKISGALQGIKGEGDDGAIIVIHTVFPESQVNQKNSEAANKVLEDFLKIHLKNITDALIKTKNS